MESPDTPTPEEMGLAFLESLLELLPLRDASDRTCFHKVMRWLVREVAAGRLRPTVFQEVLIYARECRVPNVRRPNALFMSILKKDLHYDPKSL